MNVYRLGKTFKYYEYDRNNETYTESHAYKITTLGKVRQNDQEFKARLGYAVSLRPAWAAWDPVSKGKTIFFFFLK